MVWDFSTEPEFEEKLKWMRAFVHDEVEPLDLLWEDRAFAPLSGALRKVVQPLKEEVKRQGLWACHLGRDLGGPGYGQVKLALMNEILGRTWWGPIVFGTQAPDSGNAEILAHYGSPEQKARYLQPLLEGEIFSCFSMTEPQGGADPLQFSTSARRERDSWVIRGEKWFSSNADDAAFLIALVVTDPDADPHRRMSMFIVPRDTPGLNILRNVGMMGERIGHGMHAYVHYDDVRLPLDHLLGEAGDGFHIAQTRLSGGRLHHGMRTVGQCSRAYDMMCERVLSRQTRGARLADMQFVQGYVADCWAEVQQFRLFVLNAAWVIDTEGYAAARPHVGMTKVLAHRLLEKVVARAIQVHGALGASNEMPLGSMWMMVPRMGVQDGPSEVHLMNAAKYLLRDHQPVEGLWPSEHLPSRLAAARARYAWALDEDGEGVGGA